MDARGRAAGRFLRALREGRRPADFGLDPSGRRTPGLRRSEVAELADISVEHYTNVEQARGSRPSGEVVDSLAQALRLDDDERRHLFSLAGRTAPWGERPDVSVSPNVAALVEALGETAAMVLSARLDVLAWNARAVGLMEDFGALVPAERNVARRHFLPPAGSPPHYGMTNSATFSRFVVAQLHATATRYPRDSATRALIADLRAGSDEFADLWQDPGVVTVTHMRKRLDHPELGSLSLDCDTLQDPHRDQTVVLMSVVS